LTTAQPLSFLSWNSEGLMSKLLNYDIFNVLGFYDVFGIKETWEINPDFCEQ